MSRIRTLPVTALLAALLALLMGAATVAAAVPARASASAPFCGLHWGSLAKSGGPGFGTVRDIRAGRHACYDRLVIDLGRPATTNISYDVRYVSRVVQDGSGFPVPVKGGATLQVVVIANPFDDHGRITYSPADQRNVVPVAGWRTFRQVAWAGSFEARTKVALGVRARLPFRAFTVPGGGPGDTARLVIDVAHRW